MEALAKLRNYPTSPRKMRFWQMKSEALQLRRRWRCWSIIRSILPRRCYKLLWSAVKNWEQRMKGRVQRMPVWW